MLSDNASGFELVQAFLNLANLGAAWVMWLMLALAFVLVVLTCERIWLFRKTRIDAPSIGKALLDCLELGQLDEARSLVERGQAMEERVLADGLSSWSRGPTAVEQIMHGSLQRERQRFERHLGYMGTVGSNAPFIGLLGTVIGIVLAFQDLAANPKGGMAVVGPGIAEALVSTAVGLLVAIPAVVAHNYFRGSVQRRVGNVEFLSGMVLSQLATGGK